MLVQVDFYGEEIAIPLPPTFSVFKNLISHYYVLPEADVNELIFFFDFKGSKNPLASEEDYKKLLNRPKGFPVKIIIEVSEKSKLFQEEEKKVIDLDRVREVFVNQGEKIKEVLNNQGEKAKELFQNQGAKAKEMIYCHGEKAKELWNNQGEKIFELWKRINFKENIEVFKEKCGEAYHKIEENIPYFKPEAKKEEKKENIVHARYACDGCNQHPIVGSRYKCTICNDFDFCEACEKKYGESHNHPFLKIRKPNYAPIEIKCSIRPHC